MAFTPCAMHGAMYAGGSNSFFLRLVNGQENYGGKQAVCSDCAMVILETLREKMIKVSEGDQFLNAAESGTCCNCKAPLSDISWAFFGNAYPRKQLPSQWYGQVCVECLPAVMEDFGISV